MTDADHAPAPDAPPDDATATPPAEPSARWLFTMGACIIAISCAMVFWHTKGGAVRNTNVGSRYATVEALVNHGTYAIDDTQYNRTIDKVMVDGHYLSSKPPLLPTTTAGAYWVYRRITGKDIRQDERSVVTFLNLLMIGGPHLLLLIYFLRFLLLFLRRPEAIFIGVLGAAFASLEVGYAIELNNHTVAASVAFISFYYAYRIRNNIAPKPWYWLVSGGLAGLLPGLDVPSTFITLSIGVYLFTFDRQKALTRYLPMLIPGIFTHFLLTYLSSGSIIPVYLREEAYDYPGSYWRKPRGIDALDEPKPVYAFHVLFGHHGLFSMTPPFVFAVIALYKTIKGKWERRPEAILVAAIALVLTTFYIFYTKNYGGGCVGMRWLIVAMPLLMVFFAVYVETCPPTPWRWVLIVAALGIAHYHVEDAIRSPWHNSNWHQFVEGSIKRLTR